MEAWANAIGADLDDDGLPSLSTIAFHIRQALAAAGFLPRAVIRRGLLESYAPFLEQDQVIVDKIDEVLRRMILLGDCATLVTGTRDAYVATPARLVEVETGRFVLLGRAQSDRENGKDFLRKFSHLPADLGVPKMTLLDEIGVSDWRLALLQIGGRDDPTGGAMALFAHVVGMAARGERLTDIAGGNVRVLAGRGTFFGNPQAAKVEGRWQEPDQAGTFCAVRKTAIGWKRCVVNFGGKEGRVWDTPELDLWRWAVVGQTASQGDRVFELREDVIQFCLPPPLQILRIMELTADGVGPWRWKVSPSIIKFVEGLIGL